MNYKKKKEQLKEIWPEIEEIIKSEDNKHTSETERLLAIRKKLEEKQIVPSIDKTLYKDLLKKKIEPKLKYFKTVTKENYKDFIN